MSSDKLWTVAVTIALSTLLILTYSMLFPVTSNEGTVEQTKIGLDKAINKFEKIREESKHDSILVPPNLNP
ncbi:MAG TPA: hypothetical protein VLF17_00045 [Candidatus Nitrosotenuis sp.]|nr:hypothetical protein [Candidatus Nitrosotenuis sp.]